MNWPLATSITELGRPAVVSGSTAGITVGRNVFAGGLGDVAAVPSGEAAAEASPTPGEPDGAGAAQLVSSTAISVARKAFARSAIGILIGHWTLADGLL